MNTQLALIDLPADFNSQVASNTAALVSDFSAPITLILSVLLLGTLVGILIRSMSRH